MKRVLFALTAAVAVLAAYLLLWPVSIAPAAWDAPTDRGYVGDFAPNTDLADLTLIDLDPYHGPEDIVALGDGTLLSATQEGSVLRIDPATGTVEQLADTGGVPLGMEMGPDGRVLVADAHKGLVAVSLDGTVEVLADSAAGMPMRFADDLDVGPDGTVYISDASTKFGAKEIGTTLDASLLEIMEGRGTGRLIAYSPADGSTRVVIDGLVFPNGVAVHPDGNVLLNVTGRYQVLKVDPATGASEVWIDNLPGFPDNINRGPDGTFLIGIVSPRSAFLDDYSGSPAMRRLAMRLPASMRPQAQPYGLIVQADADGRVIRTWHDPSGAYETTTGAVVVGDRLYVTSLLAEDLGYTSYP